MPDVASECDTGDSYTTDISRNQPRLSPVGQPVCISMTTLRLVLRDMAIRPGQSIEIRLNADGEAVATVAKEGERFRVPNVDDAWLQFFGKNGVESELLESNMSLQSPDDFTLAEHAPFLIDIDLGEIATILQKTSRYKKGKHQLLQLRSKPTNWALSCARHFGYRTRVKQRSAQNAEPLALTLSENHSLRRRRVRPANQCISWNLMHLL